MTNEILPPDTSKRGDNTHMVTCEVYDGARHYAACLHVKQLMDESKSRPIDRDCCRAINTGECPAMKMQAQERAAGVALFYAKREATPRSQATDVTQPGYQKSWARGTQSAGGLKGRAKVTNADFEEGKLSDDEPRQQVALVPRAPRRPAPAPAAPSGNLYADVINKMMQENKSK